MERGPMEGAFPNNGNWGRCPMKETGKNRFKKPVKNRFEKKTGLRNRFKKPVKKPVLNIRSVTNKQTDK